MNVIVKKGYPVEKLPADLREGLSLGERVEVRVTYETNGQQPIDDQFSRFFHLQRAHFRSADEVAAHVRELRDERER